MKLKSLLDGVEVASIIGNEYADISSVAFDSRKVKTGCIFVAIKGFEQDGHRFIEDAIEKGAVAIVAEEFHSVPSSVSLILVEDPRKALAKIASNFYQTPSSKIKLIGITGTNGKTTTAFMLRSILQVAGIKTGVIGTIGLISDDGITKLKNTTPESLELEEFISDFVSVGYETVVMEVSSHSLALNRVEFLNFDRAIFTNISSREHLDFHITFENYIQAKYHLLDLLHSSKKSDKAVIINLDDPVFSQLKEKTSCPVIGFSLNGIGDISGKVDLLNIKGSKFTLKYRDSELFVRLKIPGLYNIKNALAASACAISMGISMEEIKAGLEALVGVPGRFELIDEGQPFSVIVDYAHTDSALSNLLSSARHCSPTRLITIFGCGGDRDRSKRPQMASVAFKFSDFVIITQDNPRTEDPQQIINDILKGIPQNYKNYLVIQDRKEAIYEGIKIARAGDMVVIAGKGHEDYQIFGKRKIPFDDRQVAKEAIKSLKLTE